MRVLVVQDFKSFIHVNSYFLMIQDNAIDQAMKIDPKMGMSIGF